MSDDAAKNLSRAGHIAANCPVFSVVSIPYVALIDSILHTVLEYSGLSCIPCSKLVACLFKN